MTTHRSCPYCQALLIPYRGMYPAHFSARREPCPASWAPITWRTTLRATWRGIVDLVAR